MYIFQQDQTQLVICDRLPTNLWSSVLLTVVGRTFKFDKSQNTLTINHNLFTKTQIALSDIQELHLVVDNDFEVSTYMMVWISLLLANNQSISISYDWAELVDMDKIMQAIATFLKIKVSERKTLDLIIAHLEQEITNGPEDSELNQELTDFLDKRACNTLDLIIDYLKFKISQDPEDFDLQQKLEKVQTQKVNYKA
ncbi:hypothetical protein Syn7502_03119 [Synechococcus sp. PCC 7502]|uniref:hypothetical protein n=1 Tax=Synechococcus sp. PCC 7502 TaxID=1173263 RepID=UPI00029FC281|nr:hypothetical protein [Synechococcus sp. PCC 7502]AFY75016.1 hypothetical protein Syn7502_03119 [Synechococcus sp. PCC 7502]